MPSPEIERAMEFAYPYTWKLNRLKFMAGELKVPPLPRRPNARVEYGIPVQTDEQLRLVFESANSDWKQGVTLRTVGVLSIEGVKYRRGAVIFQHENKREVDVRVVESKDGILWVWNVWDNRSEPPRATLSKVGECGMLVEGLPDGLRFLCNEGRDDDDYDDLIFRIERQP